MTNIKKLDHLGRSGFFYLYLYHNGLSLAPLPNGIYLCIGRYNAFYCSQSVPKNNAQIPAPS